MEQLPAGFVYQGEAGFLQTTEVSMNINKFVWRTLINAVGLYLAILIVPGVDLVPDDWVSFVWLALIFGVLNASVRPLLKLLTCPLIILTLGLGTLVINTVMLYLLQWAAGLFSIGFTLAGFWQAFLGALVVSIVSVFLTMLFKDEVKGKRG
jgi:putative membrane protein